MRKNAQAREKTCKNVQKGVRGKPFRAKACKNMQTEIFIVFNKQKNAKKERSKSCKTETCKNVKPQIEVFIYLVFC